MRPAAQEERPLYLFDKHFAEKCPELANDYSIPPYFADDLLYKQRAQWRVIARASACLALRVLRARQALAMLLVLCCAGWFCMSHALLSRWRRYATSALRRGTVGVGATAQMLVAQILAAGVQGALVPASCSLVR